MELSAKYNPGEVEDKWYKIWMEEGCFHASPDPAKAPYCIVIPPPNVTGVLHMGHMLNNTIQDILVRKARMEGKMACWVPGTDHASIATEARVVNMLREKGIKKSDLGREEFLKHAWEWKEKYGGIILEQLKKLGASCDWERTRFTMEPSYYDAVIKVFVDLYKKGYIYRGLRMINWDCEAKTALSNEEVIYKEEGEKSKLYSVRYKIQGSKDEWITIATTRPETILADTAIAVNPGDERYKHLAGKFALVPFIDRPIPVIFDDYVDKEFGTGCLKVTPAHDPNDYEIGLRHNLEVIDIIEDDGKINDKCGVEAYIGKDRFVVRKMIVKDLEDQAYLTGTEEIVNKIGRSERTNSVVEPKLSLQWFVNMQSISKRALKAVEDDDIVLYPSKFKNTYRHWMENVKDWCISRQLWWGHRIPAWYYGESHDDFVVATNEEEALVKAREKSGNASLQSVDLKQDPDVLDTWASSWLWPIEVFDGFDESCFNASSGEIQAEKNADLRYFYPTDVLVTAPEILFFWVARMIIAGYEYMGEKPFKDVYLTGIVRDKQGRKMSKSLGNSPEPLELITKYSADGVRVGMLFSSPAGNDLLFDEKLCEQGRNFCNKIWNSFRLVKGWEITDGKDDKNEIFINWFESRFNNALIEINDHFVKYRISDALQAIYKLFWDDFCAWYLELVKPAYGDPIDQYTYENTLVFFEKLLKVLHPFMPFITEEIWNGIRDRGNTDRIMLAQWPVTGEVEKPLIILADKAFEIIAGIRNTRNAKQISPKEPLELFIQQPADYGNLAMFDHGMKKLANLSQVYYQQKPEADHTGFMAGTVECFIPLLQGIDLEKEKSEVEKELEYARGFLSTVLKKLDNERFVSNAPAAVVEAELKKKNDALQKIAVFEEKLKQLNALK
ncbi:MAG: valine--tRNA ligase [Cyclobacteriaceae bacterium]|nr:valine--tRNA ligase [Cyclobacteriaceae bacterium]